MAHRLPRKYTTENPITPEELAALANKGYSLTNLKPSPGTAFVRKGMTCAVGAVCEAFTSPKTKERQWTDWNAETNWPRYSWIERALKINFTQVSSFFAGFDTGMQTKIEVCNSEDPWVKAGFAVAKEQLSRL